MLGFYNNSQLTLMAGDSWSGRLVAFVDYEFADVDRADYVVVRVEDVFLQYNRAKGFNNETGRFKDEVVLVEPAKENATVGQRHSSFVANLGAGGSFERDGFMFEVCSLNNSGPPDYAEMRIYPVGSPLSCSNSLTLMPTPIPTPGQAPAPTPTPTLTPTRPPSEPVELNDFCTKARGMPFGTLAGSTEGGAIDGNVTCVAPSSPGAWYTVIGTGSEININTCWSETLFDTILVVFKGDCEFMSCVANNDDAIDADACNSPLKSSVTWMSELGVEYKVLVYGFSSSTGSFNLTMEDVTSRVGHVAPNRDSPLSHVRSSSIKAGQLP